jgi:hypothetical protein
MSTQNLKGLSPNWRLLLAILALAVLFGIVALVYAWAERRDMQRVEALRQLVGVSPYQQPLESQDIRGAREMINEYQRVLELYRKGDGSAKADCWGLRARVAMRNSQWIAVGKYPNAYGKMGEFFEKNLDCR